MPNADITVNETIHVLRNSAEPTGLDPSSESFDCQQNCQQKAMKESALVMREFA